MEALNELLSEKEPGPSRQKKNKNPLRPRERVRPGRARRDDSGLAEREWSQGKMEQICCL